MTSALHNNIFASLDNIGFSMKYHSHRKYNNGPPTRNLGEASVCFIFKHFVRNHNFDTEAIQIKET